MVQQILKWINFAGNFALPAERFVILIDESSPKTACLDLSLLKKTRIIHLARYNFVPLFSGVLALKNKLTGTLFIYILQIQEIEYWSESKHFGHWCSSRKVSLNGLKPFERTIEQTTGGTMLPSDKTITAATMTTNRTTSYTTVKLLLQMTNSTCHMFLESKNGQFFFFFSSFSSCTS